MNNELKPKIRFKGFNDVWEQRKLGDIGSTFTGLSGKTKEDFGHGDAKFVTYMNVFSNPIANLDKTEPIEIDNKQNEVKYGDIFFTTSSETPEEVGMSSVWLENKANVYLNSFCFGYRPLEKNNPYYMAYMLRANNFRSKMILLAQGISRYNISKNAAMDIEIQLPKNKEQESIGKLFYEIDNLITLHQRKYDKLIELKKSLLEKMFPQNNSVIPEIRFKRFTDDWEQRKLDEVGNIITGTTPSTNDESNYNGDYLFVSPADINMNRYIEKTNTTLSKKGFESGRILNEGAVLFVSIGSTIGKVAQTKEKSTTNQQINAIEVNEKNNNNFIYSLLEKHSSSIRSGASTQAVPILNKTSFSLLEFDMPKINEQEKIGILFENIDNLITLHQRKHDKLNKIKQSLLNDMFV